MNEVVCCYCPRNTELSLGFWSSRHKRYVSSPVVVFFVSYMHVHAPFIMYCSRFVVVFQEMNCLHICSSALPSFMHVSAVVSELCQSNQNKKEEKIGYLTPFLDMIL